MELIDYLKKLHGQERDVFADRCETSIGHLTNVAYGYKPCGITLAVLIERESNGSVSRERLRPHDYWLIWPDLPAPAQQEVGNV